MQIAIIGCKYWKINYKSIQLHFKSLPQEFRCFVIPLVSLLMMEVFSKIQSSLNYQHTLYDMLQ